MNNSQARVIFSCARCGSGAFNTPYVSDDSFVVTCQFCRVSIRTVGEIEGTAKNEALRKASIRLKAIRIE